jgi:squalene-hopene/tetraprenyl-beta-curcumene cyclase
MEKEILESQFNTLCSQLLKEQNKEGFWSGRLSSSALSTAVSIVALKINKNSDDALRIKNGYDWLCENINEDGGFGDTSQSESNVSTSLLCYAAVFYCRKDYESGNRVLLSIENFLETKNISFTTQDITSSILKFYGNDYTFSVPILSMLTLCGVLSSDAFNHIPQLPFELSLLPVSWYRFFNFQVVSYAIPALIGVGFYIYKQRQHGFSLSRWYRKYCTDPAIKKLTALLPESGGFLEAIPLTGFVDMCLIASGEGNNSVVQKGMLFLQHQQREDGSWPIDTDLSTWVTTLSVKALGQQLKSVVSADKVQQLKTHLLSIQYKTVHPFNDAKPGGWGWTNYSGSVPDADDTPGAILALLEMYDGNLDEVTAIINGCHWLMDIQNSDGGFPTFCKGWGRLPFDSSCADLTGHALLALLSTLNKLGDKLPASTHRKFYSSALKASVYLQKHQASDGHWLPLWFGNQLTDDKKNPVYGTAKVAVYLEDCLTYTWLDTDIKKRLDSMVASAKNYLLSQQNPDGSWGGKKETAGTIEETALAIGALANTHKEICLKGFSWLLAENRPDNLHSSPIGLYFAALWYDEKMYPLVYFIEALRRFLYS